MQNQRNIWIERSYTDLESSKKFLELEFVEQIKVAENILAEEVKKLNAEIYIEKAKEIVYPRL